MYKELKLYTILGVIFTLIFGSLLHFLYQWTGENPLVAWFAPVNESIWEHLKLLFFPMLFYTLLGTFCFKNSLEGVLGGGTLGAVGGMFSILVCYYTYSGILGRSLLWMDILCFAASVLFAFFLMNYFIRNAHFSRRLILLCLFLLILFSACFAVFTWYPPSIQLFENPSFSEEGNRAMMDLSYITKGESF